MQPVDPEHAWRHPPFEPAVVDGECLARGAIDDKGQVLYQVEAMRGLLAVDGRLPVNVKLLVEGEEEIGSPHFEALLRTHAVRLAADVIVVSDTGMLAEDLPSTDVSMRGLVAFTVTLTTSTTDLHSGIFGGAVPNPLHHLNRLLAGLHDDDGRVAIPGFTDDVAELAGAEAASLAAQPFDEEEFRRLAGVPFLEGERGRSTLERVGSRPTAEVVGMSGGYTGDGIKTIVPSSATAQGDVPTRPRPGSRTDHGVRRDVDPRSGRRRHHGRAHPPRWRRPGTHTDRPLGVRRTVHVHRTRVGCGTASDPGRWKRPGGDARARCSAPPCSSSVSACPATASTHRTSAW